MAKLSRLKAQEAEKLLFKAGFKMVRSKGSHRIYKKGDRRIIVPFHTSKTLHPKIIKQILKSIND
ncbi:MAG: type II toxin-antitoxin system HicA family toxin [Actinobacteria bacterium]|nr:type II toxin-antitoxin system HicA family toxin [Actinomycetota bacterium]